MLQEFFVAACLMLVLEGMLPFLAPIRWRQVMLSVLGMADSQIRRMGLISMVLGATLLYMFN